MVWASAVATPARRDPASVLVAYVAVLIAVPSRLVVAPLGAVGTPAILIGVLALLWWAVSFLVADSGIAHGLSPVRIAVVAVAAAVIASYAAAATHPMSAAVSSALDRGLIVIAAGSGIALIAADGIDRIERVQTVLRWLVGATAALAALGILQFFTGFDITEIYRNFPGLTANADLAQPSWRSSFRRVSGTALHPIEFGVVLAMVFPLAIHFALHARPARRLRYWVAVGLIATGVPMSLSRSAILGVVIGGAVLLAAWSWRRRAAAMVVSAAFLTLMYFAVPGLVGTIKSYFVNQANDPSVIHRTQDYALVGGFISQRPILGQGFNTFDPVRYFFLDNQYLGLLIETGIVGTAAVVGLILTGWCCARGARLRAHEADTRHLGQALAAAAAVALVSFFFFDALGFPMVTGISFLVFGCCGALWRLEARPNRG